MRLFSLRSIAFACLALCASMILYSAPAVAKPIDPGVYVLRVDAAAAAVSDFKVMVDKAIVHREAAAFLNSDHDLLQGAAGDRMPFGLSPEYAESYATDGLNFIDLRRRC